MKCIICNSEKSNERKCPICGFTSLNIQPGTPQEIIDKYNEEVARAKEKWQESHSVSSYDENDNQKNKGIENIDSKNNDRSYETKWTENSPGHLVYLVDLSESMSMLGEKKEKDYTKYNMVMESIRECIRAILAPCIQGNKILPLFSLTIIGYNSDVYTLFKGNADQVVKLLAETKRNNNRLFYDAINEKIREDAEPKWQTYMEDGLKAAKKDIEEWITQQKMNPKVEAIPSPIVISITDGHPEEKERKYVDAANGALNAAKDIMENIDSPDGHVLLFNIHIDPAKNKEEILFPVDEPLDRDMSLLYKMSSTIPTKFIKKSPFAIKTGCKGMISNAKDSTTVLRFIEFGSTITQANKESPKIV